MKRVVITGIIIFILLALNFFIQYSEYNDRKNLVIRTHLEMEMFIIKGVARSAESWFKYNIIELRRDKSTVQNEVFKYFVEPVKIFKNGDAWIYNNGYVIFDRSSDFPDIYRDIPIDKIFEIQKQYGASHYQSLVHGILNGTEDYGWYIWLPDKGKEWVAWTSVSAGKDVWTIGLSTPEDEIFEHNGMRVYFKKTVVNSIVISSLLVIIFFIVFLMKKNDLINERRILREKKTAEDANRTKSRFLANISHEIRTPINSIMGMTYLLSQSDLKPSQREYISLIESSSDYLMETINQLLDISKIEAGKLELENEVFSLINTVSLLNRIFSITAHNKKLNFIFDNRIAEAYSSVRGDQKVLKHILNNLLGNAIKYTDCGSIHLAADAGSEAEDRVWLKIEVVDSGAGISKENINRIFDYFYQVDSQSSGNKSGTGLGLTIVRDLVKLSGGRIEVESEPGKGSCFRVMMYYEKADSHAAVSESEFTPVPVKYENPESGNKRASILIAEDDRISSIFIKSILKKIPCETVHVENGSDALAAVRDAEFDMLIIDGEMPVMNGIETIRQIREDESAGKLKRNYIIALSAYAAEGERKNFIDAGADEYISKPINPESLISLVKMRIAGG